jgi:hypothetical protein
MDDDVLGRSTVQPLRVEFWLDFFTQNPPQPGNCDLVCLGDDPEYERLQNPVLIFLYAIDETGKSLFGSVRIIVPPGKSATNVKSRLISQVSTVLKDKRGKDVSKEETDEPWAEGRVRIDFPREGEAEGTSAVSLESQFARCQLRFRKETTFRQVADVRFGIEFEQSSDGFLWQLVLVPVARYPRLDDLLWNHWRFAAGGSLPPGSAHQVKANTILFAQRPVTPELTGDVAFNDVKLVLERLLSAGTAIAEAVGFEPEE